MDHGPVSWLSNDTRVFKLQPNSSVGGVTLGNDPIAFIQALLAKLRTQNTPAEIQQNYQIFENLPATEAGADLEWLPMLNNQPVWNFALCRVRYRATMDLLRKSGEFPVSNEELNDTATTVYEGI
jgi:hypothetical protein